MGRFGFGWFDMFFSLERFEWYSGTVWLERTKQCLISVIIFGCHPRSRGSFRRRGKQTAKVTPHISACLNIVDSIDGNTSLFNVLIVLILFTALRNVL